MEILLDVVIIGVGQSLSTSFREYLFTEAIGPSELCAAKTLLECEPGLDLKILDAEKKSHNQHQQRAKHASETTTFVEPSTTPIFPCTMVSALRQANMCPVK